jgi:hypothetical protein
MNKRLLAIGATALGLAAGPAGAWAVVGPGPSSAPAGTSQATAQSAYQTALTAQINPFAASIADASATTIVNFYQYRINSAGDDTIYAFTMGGTAFSVAANINSTTQVTNQDTSQSITQGTYETIVQAAMQAAGQPAS